MPKWLKILETIGPAVLAVTPLAPITPLVIGAISTAEAIPGATGAQKKALVQQLVATGAEATNTAAGKTVINPQQAVTTAGSAIDTVVGVVNLAHGQLPAE